MIKILFTTSFAILFCYSLVLVTRAAITSRPISEKENALLNRQAEVLLREAEKGLLKDSPAYPLTDNRKRALYLLDAVLHEPVATTRTPVQDYLARCIKRVITELKEYESGIQVWKTYNHGFIVRTPEATIGFDLTRIYYLQETGFFISNEDMSRLIDACDILFISHAHADHADKWVAAGFLDAGKPVIGPDNLWKHHDFYKQIIHPERDKSEQIIKTGNHNTLLQYKVYPGHQDSLQNNIYSVTTPSGLTVAHTGDQCNHKDLEWIQNAHKSSKIDILLMNCWAPALLKTIQGFAPKLVITGHENEMGHSVDHREAYWLTINKLENCQTPWIVLSWGEAFKYKGHTPGKTIDTK